MRKGDCFMNAFCVGLYYLKSKEINILCKFIHKTKLITLDTLIVWTME